MSNFQKLNIAYFCSQNQQRPPPGERKKQANFVDARKMKHHIDNCAHPYCKKLWSTRWGTYIGTAEGGELDFPLTLCP